MAAKKKKKAAKRADYDVLLVEIGTEELPPKSLRQLGEAFAQFVVDGLMDAGLIERAEPAFHYYAAPRRLAVSVSDVRFRQPDREIEKRGPALKAAFDEGGQPTRALLGFTGSLGIKPSQLGQVATEKGAWVVYRAIEKGQLARKLVPDIVEQALNALPIPKRMRWGDLAAEFVRPVHWLILMHGDKVVPAEILATRSGRKTFGHRFHHPGAISLKHAREYETRLKREGYVLADFAARRQKIEKDVQALAIKNSGKARIDVDLLDEVTALVEWPRPVLGKFDKEFLDVPQEALVLTMQDNQKYFPVVNRSGKMLPFFITVSNINSRGKAQVRAGNERVLRARFADARFFWEQDQKQSLASRSSDLEGIVFHIKLGSLAQKVGRVANLAGTIADALNTDAAMARRAASLAKNDLVSGMVGEFPELQGIMGHYYARHDKETGEIPLAVEEHYLPRHAGDKLPTTQTGMAVAVADRIDTLVGIFGVNEVPTGDKDPFGLRRSALGVLRILIEKGLDLDLKSLIEKAITGYENRLNNQQLATQVYDYMMERLRVYYGDQGIAVDVFESVLACQPSRPLDFHKRVNAVRSFLKLKAADSLTAANKRIRNILRQGGDLDWDHVSTELLQQEEEKKLHQHVLKLQKELEPVFAAGDYEAAMNTLARLRTEVDAFFDNVMVMVDEEAVRDNRLALLSQLGNLFLRVADLSRLQG